MPVINLLLQGFVEQMSGLAGALFIVVVFLVVVGFTRLYFAKLF